MKSSLGLTLIQLFCVFYVYAISISAEKADQQELKKNHKHINLWKEQWQQSRQTRHKRDTVTAPGTTARPHIVVHHYHYYYYCCPDMAARVRDDPRLAQAVHNASCGCDQNSFYCRVPSPAEQHPHLQQQQQQHHSQHHQGQQRQQQQHHPQHQGPQQGQQQQNFQQHQEQQQQQHQQQHHQQHQGQQQHQQQKQQHQQPSPESKTHQVTKQPHQQDPFHINRMFNDPIDKDFFDFVTNNFVRRDDEGDLDCLLTPFDDPICKDFFSFFNQNFMRKPEKHSGTPSNVSTHTPSHTTQQIKSHQGNNQHPQRFKDFKDFQKVDSMFNELENNMKKAFSKTADLGKILGIKLDDFR